MANTETSIDASKSQEIQQGVAFLGLLNWIIESRKLSLNQLGKRIGFSRSYLSKIQSGQLLPSENFILACEKFLGGQQQ